MVDKLVELQKEKERLLANIKEKEERLLASFKYLAVYVLGLFCGLLYSK